MAIFATVIEAGSFTAAAAELNMGKAAVSKAVRALEDELETRLLHRTTRSLGLTDTGRRFHASCLAILEEAEAAQALVREGAQTPQGTLRVACPVDVGRTQLMPLIAAFQAKYPAIHFDLLLSDDIVDIVRLGVDVAIRAGQLRDSSFISRKLRSLRLILCASPDFMVGRPTPTTPQEAAALPWLLMSRVSRPNGWMFKRGDESVSTQPHSTFRTDSPGAATEGVLAGLGVAPVVDFAALPLIADGRLIQLVPEWSLVHDLGIFAVFPDRRFQPVKVRLFVEALQAHFAQLCSGC